MEAYASQSGLSLAGPALLVSQETQYWLSGCVSSISLASFLLCTSSTWYKVNDPLARGQEKEKVLIPKDDRKSLSRKIESHQVR